MSIRKDPIYVSHEVFYALRMIGKATPRKADAMGIQTATPDEIADLIISEVIAAKFPQIKGVLKQRDAEEKALIESLKCAQQ